MPPWLLNLLLLAQDVPEEAPDVSPWSSFMVIMIPTLAFMLIMQYFFGRNDQKEKDKRNQFIANLKKNDPVVTIGGILGTFISASADKSEVTIRVDDNTRLKLQASAIREVVAKEPEAPAKNT